MAIGRLVGRDRGDYSELLCPMCESEYVHINHAEVMAQSPDPTFYVRGHVIALSGYCEQGCEFTLYYGQHKGSTQIAVRGATLADRVCAGHHFDSPPERDFWVAIWREGVEWVPESLAGFVPQVPVVAGGRNYRLDFGDTERKLGIEVDGKAYHNGQESFVRDRERQRDLEMDGWRVLRFAAKEVMDDARGCVEKAREWAAAL